ncbi:glycerol-3-phosphate 1-O-acyltransferase PlsY [uncultured Parasphingopyxis sp.]|uniref:glycerol-3-phosphate 1-O-acyltransferase PlsY n=1 Tax=uncultured Parasphingopyxis sp. TaxID=1547918 RepID=UPI00262EA334|nr:glycerol-3-phosphate 1-O-acyltransferase PlsY [uncultured Parasphingopyxis sp.]
MFTDPAWLAPALVLLLGYLLGSTPFGILLTRAFGAGDLRQIGSGNIGATNVLRTGRKGLAAATLVLDLLKGFAAVTLAPLLGGDPESQMRIAAAAAFIGHCYPIWLKLDGGKGVATLGGIAFGFGWVFGGIYAVTWLGILAILRWSSVAGLCAASAMPVVALVRGETFTFILFLALALIVFWKHRSNIARLIRGEEPKVGGAKGG